MLALSDSQMLSRLVELSVTLNSTLELGPLLKFLLRTAADLLECEKASILLYNETRGDLSFLSATGDDAADLTEIPVPLHGSIAGLIFRKNEPVIINDVANDPQHFSKVSEKTGFLAESLMGVPMHLRGETTGVIEALNKREGKFTLSDAQLLEVVASQAAVAIHNAQLVQDLRRADAELRRVDKIKTDFMHLATHELRTPLAIITSYAEFLKMDSQGRASEHATRVLDAALRQRAIIDSMANMNLLQLGTLDLKRELVALQDVLRAARADCQDEADVEKVRMQMTLADPPIVVRGDAQQLELVFKNILNNAILFTPAGGNVTITLQTDKANATVSMRDTGVGIPAGELTNIFKDFYQVQDHMTRRHGGLGLGLSIARGIVQLHGGRIWAESPGPDQGSTFKIALPLEENP